MGQSVSQGFGFGCGCLLLIVAIFVVLIVIGRGSGSSDTSPGSGDYGGNSAVYQRIATETDCDALQAEFDTAAANHDRDSAAGDLEAMRWSTGYMGAADDRMREIGCYE